MKLDRQHILRVFRMFAEPGDSDLQKYEPLLRGAEEEILKRLKPEADLSCNMERLCEAAAAEAYYMYLTLVSPANAADEIRVGDISVRSPSGASSGKLNDARLLRDEYMSRVSGLMELADSQKNFAFVTAEVKL